MVSPPAFPHFLSIDLHTHSTFSDGVLAPVELVQRAAARGVRVLALTDHDATDGLDEALRAARACGIDLVPGVEISVTWNEQTLHILGLGIGHRDAGLQQGLAGLRREREARALQIAARLDAAGIPGSHAGATRHAGKAIALGRSHFARFLVQQRHVRNADDAFRLYLGAGRPAYVAPAWPCVETAVAWIHGASGQAVLAHPDRYRLSPRMMRSLFMDFRQAGGDGIEVNAEGRFPSSTQVRLALEFGFALSSGSDFHAPGKNVPDLGEVTAIPEGMPAIHLRLRAAAA